MAHKSKYVHRKHEIIIKLLKELSDFMSDEQIAAIATRILHTKITDSEVLGVRYRHAIRLEKNSGRPLRGRSCTDLYDHRNIREFLDKNKESDILKKKRK